MNPTKIPYLTHTWNPLAMRCTRITPACDHCWHLAMANRLAKNPLIKPEVQAAYAGEMGPVLIASRLGEPLKRKKPAVIGLQFMGDLFHPSVPEAFTWAAIEAAWEASQHTFLILTKRPARMLDVLTRSAWWNNDTPGNIWLGVTVENQATADSRRAAFEAVPAALKFVSYEPALGAVDWSGWEFVDWFISGGETGPGARPSHPDWHRATRDFCVANGKSYFFKQWGEWLAESQGAGWNAALENDDSPNLHCWHSENTFSVRVGNARTGNLLDGEKWEQMPEESK